MRPLLPSVLAGVLALGIAATAVPLPDAAAAPTPRPAAHHATRSLAHQPIGAVLRSGRLKHSLWVPGAARGVKLTYVSTDTFGKKAISTGEVFLPKGKAPKGGWPVISWAHGTSGLADKCAPSIHGPAERGRDFSYLHNWIKEGYAIVASDYVGLGTKGRQAYLDGRNEAHNVVDMVKAGRRWSHDHLPRRQQLSNKWVVIGQSQGGGAAVYTARFATKFGGKRLDYLGAVATGAPAYIEDLVSLAGPETPPVALPTAGLTSYLATIVESMRYARPGLHLGDILTKKGEHATALTEKLCIVPLEEEMKSETIGDWFTAPLAARPHWKRTIDRYMAMPEKGFDKPFFMANGLEDTDVPFATTAAYVAALKANNQPVTFKTYPKDHSGTLIASQKDSHPFVAKLFRQAR